MLKILPFFNESHLIAQPLRYRLTRSKPSPIFGPYKERVEALLHQNEQMPRKQRYTFHRIFEVIRSEGYQGSESRLRQYVATRRSATQIPQCFCHWNSSLVRMPRWTGARQ